MGTAYNANIVTDSLALCLDAANPRSYPGSGTSWYDLSTSKNNGTLNNSPSFSSDKMGAFVFDATNENISTDIMSFGNAFTICFAMYMRQLYNYGDPVGATTNANTDFGMSFVSYADGHMVFGVGDGTSWGSSATTSAGFLSNNTWYYITGVKTTTTTNLYINGNFIHSASNTKTLNNHKIILGGRWPGQYPFKGSISSLLVYNYDLSPNEVRQNFNATRGRYGI